LTIIELRQSEKKYINQIEELEEKRINLKKKLNSVTEFIDEEKIKPTKNTGLA
jgi:hypothetical protein